VENSLERNSNVLFHLQRQEEKQRVANTFEKALNYVLLVMFVLYPKLTHIVFEGFPCCAKR
jgi:hypothetical protein